MSKSGLSRKSLIWGIALGLAFVSARLAIRHFQNPPTPPDEGPLPSPSAYVATPENSTQLGRYVDGVLTFSLLHEIGHMIISEHNVPVLGREEDAADRFAVMYLSQDVNAPYSAALLSAPLFFDGYHRITGPAGYDFTNEHGEPRQRAFSIRCLLYGSDPHKWAQLGVQMGVPAERLQQCVDEAAKNGKDWRDVFLAHLNTSDNQIFGISVPRVAVVYEPVPASTSGSLSGARETVMDHKLLENVGANMAAMKLPPASGMLRSAAGRDGLKQPSFSVDKVLDMPRPGVNIRAAGDDLKGFDYVVQGDACLDGQGAPEANAYWHSGSRALTLCYGLVNLVVNVGKALIVEGAAASR